MENTLKNNKSISNYKYKFIMVIPDSIIPLVPIPKYLRKAFSINE